jgi:arginine exporter protein ArgO
MIVTPEVAPFLTAILIGVALVLAIGASGIAILMVGPRRPSALVIPTIASFAMLLLASWGSGLLGMRGIALPLFGAVVTAFVVAFLRRPRPTDSVDDHRP